jgi:hypothetical protein
MILATEARDKSSVFIHGMIGKMIKDALGDLTVIFLHEDPDKAILNDYLSKVWDALDKLKKEDIKKIVEVNERANNIRQITDYIHSDKLDELSRGAAILGEVKQQDGKLSKLRKKEDRTDYIRVE